MNDFLLAQNGDLAIEDGDLVIGTSDQQHQSDLLLIDKGSCKEFPELGVGLFRHLEDEDQAALLRDIKVNFNADGMRVNNIEVLGNGKVQVDAEYV